MAKANAIEDAVVALAGSSATLGWLTVIARSTTHRCIVQRVKKPIMEQSSAFRIGALRLLVGLIQGGTLWLLYEANQASRWPATDIASFRSLLATALFVPCLSIFGIGNLRFRSLALWLAACVVLCAGLGFYAGFREAPLPNDFRVIVWPNLYLSLFCLLFIGHSLVTAADGDRRWIARFPTYFDVSWKHAVQLALAAMFVGLLWGVLWLGAQLFSLINVGFVAATLEKSWFWIIVTTLAFSAAVHATDAGAPLVRGARTLVLSLLSWLMPIMVLIGSAFLIALLFTGLEPLWRTRHATGSLMAAAIILILLINSHFRDGQSEVGGFRVLTCARFVAALMLTPLVVLASVGLSLRVGQYGWTPSRIVVGAGLLVISCHAFGYAVAAIRSGLALRGLPMTNVLSAFAMIGILIALLTPVADPARLSVKDLVARLESGGIAPGNFDYLALRFDGVRYGWEALERLKDKREGPNAAQIATKAAEALSLNH